MSWVVGIKVPFDSAHLLRGYEGKCSRLHGHRWELELAVQSNKLDSVGMAYDFIRLKEMVRKDLEHIDHYNLNDIPPFDKINPTAENLACFFYERYAPVLVSEGYSLRYTKIWETPTAYALFGEDI